MALTGLVSWRPVLRIALGGALLQGCQVLLAVDPGSTGAPIVGGLDAGLDASGGGSPATDSQAPIADAEPTAPEGGGSGGIPGMSPDGGGDSDRDGGSIDLDASDATDATTPDASDADSSDVDSGCQDSDGDGVCDANDVCTGNDATGDSDIDGICDSDDSCVGNDGTGDSDGDGTCDDIDSCPALNAPTDCSWTCVDLLTDDNHCRTCGNPCSGGETCTNGTCIYDGMPPALSFVLRWSDVPSNLELFVRTAAGNTISYMNPSADGGTRYVGSTKGPGAEQVIWASNAPSGTYEVCVIGLAAPGNGAPFTVEVLANNVVTQTGSGTAFREGAPPATTCAASDGTHVLSYVIP